MEILPFILMICTFLHIFMPNSYKVFFSDYFTDSQASVWCIWILTSVFNHIEFPIIVIMSNTSMVVYSH